MSALAAEAADLVSCGEPVPVLVARPPPEFAEHGLKRVPALVCGTVALDNADDIAAYLHEVFPGAGLAYGCPEAELATAGVFSRFCFYMKPVSRDPNHLEAELRKLDALLAAAPGPFLCCERLSQLDCEVMPKLQHLRVACATFKGYSIGVELAHFWRYMHRTCSEEAFARTCPVTRRYCCTGPTGPGPIRCPSSGTSRYLKRSPSTRWTCRSGRPWPRWWTTECICITLWDVYRMGSSCVLRRHTETAELCGVTAGVLLRAAVYWN